MMRTQFNHDFISIQQKGRRIPVHLQERVEGEFNKLMDQNHVIKLDECSDRQFISPIVITVKKDQTVKLASDSQNINKFIHKNKYQMPNIDLLLDNIAEVVKSDKSKQTQFSTIDLRYAYLQFLWIKRPENNAILVLLVVTPLGPISFKQDFMASRICRPNSKSD